MTLEELNRIIQKANQKKPEPEKKNSDKSAVLKATGTPGSGE